MQCKCVCLYACHKAFTKVTATFKIWKICDPSDKDRTESIEVAQQEDLFNQIITYKCIFYHSFTFFLFNETIFCRVFPEKKDKKVTWANQQSMFSKPLRYTFLLNSFHFSKLNFFFIYFFYYFIQFFFYYSLPLPSFISLPS